MLFILAEEKEKKLPKALNHHAMTNFPIDKSYLVGGWLASALWGAFTVVFAFCIISVITRPGGGRNHVTTGVVVVMYVLATAHIALVLSRLIQAFIVHVNDDGGAILYLADISQPLNRSKDMIYITLIVLGDIVLVWRCFMVWSKNYIVIAIPCSMVVATAITGYGAVGQYFLPDPFTPTSVQWAEGMLAVSMATNLLVTALTAGKIWNLMRNLGDMSFGSSQIKYRYMILLIVESGVVIAISKTIEFILFELSPDDGLDGNNALYIVMDCMPQIMGIVPTFIILAVNRGFTSSGAEAYSGSTAYASGSGTLYSRKGTGLERTMEFATAPNTSRVGQTDTVMSVGEYPLQSYGGKKTDF